MTTKFDIIAIAKQDRDPTLVSIDYDAISRMDRSQIAGDGGANLTEGTHQMSLEEGIRYAIALNSINYRFWDLHEGAMVRYENGGKVGALAMTTAFAQAWNRESNPFSNLHTSLTTADIKNVFGDMPDQVSRVTILNEVLLSPQLRELAVDLASAVSAATDVFVLGTEHAQLLADAFPIAYSDPLLKKAQLAISAVWLACKARGFNVETDLTAFADYQIPRILRALKVIRYSEELAAKIDTYTLIEANSPEERAIRAASILAIEEMSKVHGVSSAAIDHFLWTRRNEAKEPFHLTETTAY